MSQEIKIPSVGESIRQVTIAEWSKKDGQWIEKDSVLLSFETEKATMDLVAEHSGALHILVQEGTTVGIGTLVGTIDTSATPPAPPAAPEAKTFPPKNLAAAPATAPAPAPAPASHAQGHPSPAAAAHLASSGAPGPTTGTGRDGRVTLADAKSAPAAAAPASVPAAPSAPASSIGGVRREKMSNLRRKLAQRLVSMKNQTAMTTTFNEVDLTEVNRLRAKFKDSFLQKHGVKLGYQGFFLKACDQALKEFPIVNASVDGEDIVFHDNNNISIAVNTPRGLVVPVVRNVTFKTIAEIEREVAEMAARAREGKLTIADMEGGTFSITNGGVFGSMMSTPLLNPPQSAILGMHAIQDRPMAVEGKVEIRPMMYLALSYDHRIIDGRDSVGFLLRVRRLLEDPASLLLGV